MCVNSSAAQDIPALGSGHLDTLYVNIVFCSVLNSRKCQTKFRWQDQKEEEEEEED